MLEMQSNTIHKQVIVDVNYLEERLRIVSKDK